MTTKVYTLTGECKWAKIFSPDQKYNKYSIDVKLDPKNLAIFNTIGLKSKPKEDEDGNIWVTLRRDPEATVYRAGAPSPAGAPTVTGVPAGASVGNGSVATCKLAVYDYNNKYGVGKGSRLESVHIDTLVEYKKVEVTEEGIKSPF